MALWIFVPAAQSDFFVPTYGVVVNSLTKDFIDHLEEKVISTFVRGSKAHLTLIRDRQARLGHMLTTERLWQVMFLI